MEPPHLLRWDRGNVGTLGGVVEYGPAAVNICIFLLARSNLSEIWPDYLTLDL